MFIYTLTLAVQIFHLLCTALILPMSDITIPNMQHEAFVWNRFASFIVNNDTYSITLSAYINNSKDHPDYSGKEELYPYSSYGIYTGYRDDPDEIMDTDYILKLFCEDKKAAREKYRAFTESMKGKDIIKK